METLFLCHENLSAATLPQPRLEITDRRVIVLDLLVATHYVRTFQQREKR